MLPDNSISTGFIVFNFVVTIPIITAFRFPEVRIALIMSPMIRNTVLVISIFLSLIGENFAVEEESSKVWHSYAFNTRARSREGLKLSNFTISNFGTVKNVQKWNSLKDQKRVSFLGLGENFLELLFLNGEKNINSTKTDWTGHLPDIAVFQSWSGKTKSVTNFAVVANYENNTRSILKWYQIQDGNLVYLWDWPINRIITHLNVISFNHELKLLIISHSPKTEDVASAEVYSFSVNQTLDLWLYDKFSLNDNPSTTHMSYCNDNIYLMFAFPKLETVFIYMDHKTYTGQNHFKLHHKINSKRVTSLSSFCFTFDCYVAIASSNSSIYKFNNNFDLVFVGKTDFGRVTRWLAVPLSTFQESIILLAQKENYIQVVSLYGDQQLQMGSKLSEMACGKDSSCVRELEKFSADGATSFFHDKYHYVLFTATSGESKLLRFTIQMDLLQDAVDLQLKEVLQFQSLLQAKWDEQKLKMKELSERINTVLNEREVIHPKSWKLENVKTQSIAVMMEPNETINYFEFGRNANWVANDYSIYLSLKSDGLLDELDEKLQEIESMFYNVERTATIEKPNFNGLSVDNAIFTGSVTVRELELSKLNGIHVDEMLQNSFMVGSKRKIGGVKTLTNVKADYIYFEKLNGILESDIVFSDQLQDPDKRNIIHGSIVYENEITVLEMLELLPNRNFSPSVLYPYKKAYQFMEEVTFDHLTITEELNVEETLNGRPLILPLHSSPFEVFSSDNVNQVRVEKVNIKKDLNVISVNGKNISEILREINRKSNFTPGNYSRNEFRNLTTANLRINYLNGIKFPEGFVTEKSGETITLTGLKNFTGHLIVGDLLIEDRGKKNSEKNRSNSLNVITVGDLKVKGPLLTGKINNYTWDDLGDILKQDDEPARITGKKLIKKCTFSKNLIVGELNSRNVDNIMNKFSDQNFTGRTFKDVVFEHVNITGTLDGVNVETVRDETVRLSEIKAYNCSLIFDVEVEPYFRSLEIPVKNFRTSEKEIVMYGDVKFNELNSKILIINGSLTSYNKINNVNLTEFNLNRLSLSQPQTIRGNYSHKSVSVHDLEVPDDNPENSTINMGGNSIHELLQSRSFMVDSVLVKGNIKTTKGINGFNITYIDQNAVYIHKGCNIQNKIIFEDPVTFKNLKINGRLQGIQLKRFSKDLIFDSSRVFLRSPKNFTNILTVVDKMKAGMLNGHLMQRILTKEGDHSVKGSITVNGNVRVTGNVTAYGLVNGSAIMDLINKYSPKYESYVIKDDVVLQAEEINHFVVGGLIQNKSFDSFLEEVVMVKNDASITARKVILGSVKFENNVEIADTLNGLDVERFNSDIVLINKNVEIEGDVILGKSILQNVIVRNDFNSTLIHGFDTNEWLEESIPLSDSTVVNGKKFFTNVECHNNIETDYLNGFLLASAISVNNEQLIPCSGYFTRMTTMSDMMVEGSVNDKTLGTEFSDTVLVDEDQEIEGTLTFTNNILVKNDLTVHDSHKFDVVTLYTDQKISSPVIFEGTVVANSAIDDVKYINDIDIKEWHERSISLNENQIIQGDWVIEGNVTFEKNVVGSGLLNAESVPEISKSITKVKMLTADVETRMISDYDRQCQKIANLSRMVSLQPNVFHHFEISQILKTSVSAESIITFRANDNDYLMLTFIDECLSFLYQWNKTTNRFNFMNRVNIGPISKWMTLHHKNSTYLITSSGSDVICEKNSKKGNIWIFDGHKDKYGHLFTTEGFSDLIKSNSSDGKYYTLGDNGDICRWNLTPKISSDFIANVGQGHQIFLEFAIFGELAVSDGRHVKNRQNRVIHKFAKSHNGRLIVTTVKGKKLVVVPYHDEVVLYENLKGNKIYLSVPASNAGSLIWFSSHTQQPHLVYETEQKSVDIVNFRGADRAFEKLSIPVPCHHLLFSAILREKGLRPREFLIVVQKKKVLLLEAYTAGNLYEGTGHFRVNYLDEGTTIMMDITFVYTKKRMDFGKQCTFTDEGPTLLEDIKPNKKEMEDYIYKNPVSKETQYGSCQAEHEVNTTRAEFTDHGMNHVEGGWPKDINVLDAEQTLRYRKKIEKDEAYIHTIMQLSHSMEHRILQNNAINIYESYFGDTETMPLVERSTSRTTNVYKDPAPIKRPITHLSWSPDGGSRLAVTHCNLEFQRAPTDLGTQSYIWEIENPNKPELKFEPGVPIVCLEYNPKDPHNLVSGMFSGQVCFWDTRRGSEPVESSTLEVSHRDPVHNVLWINSKSGTEFFSSSSDGQIKWWDTRKLSEPLETLILDMQKGDTLSLSRALGASSLEYEPTIPTRFMVGTENGYVIQGNRKGKNPQEKLSGVFKVHLGPVCALQRNTAFVKNFLTVGDWTARIWSEDCKESSIIWTSYHRSLLTDGNWSPTRYSVFFTTRTDGTLDVWDILQQQREATLSMKICDDPLRCLRVHEGGQFVAVGNDKGNTYLVEFSENLATNHKNDKAFLTAMFERESRREKILEARIREIRLKGRTKNQEMSGAPNASHPTGDLPEKVDYCMIAENEFFAAVKAELENTEEVKSKKKSKTKPDSAQKSDNDDATTENGNEEAQP